MGVTIDDVASAAGVSLATVSRALRGLPNVAPATRARVVVVAERLGYRPDPSASRLATGESRTIGLLTGGIHSWYAGRLLAGVEAVLAGNGYDLLLSVVVRDHPAALVDRVVAMEKRADALLMLDLFLEEEEVEAVAASFDVVVTAGSRAERFDSVVIDNRGAAIQVARHLARLGHERIAMIEGDPGMAIEYSAGFSRAQGFRAGLAEHGLSVMETDHGGFTTEGGTEAALRLMTARQTPTAVFAFSDEMAFGVLRAAESLGLEVPGDLSVVGFDDHDLSEYLDLTTVRQDVVELGALAARRVLAQLTERTEPLHETAPTTLVVRGSTGVPPSAR